MHAVAVAIPFLFRLLPHQTVVTGLQAGVSRDLDEMFFTMSGMCNLMMLGQVTARSCSHGTVFVCGFSTLQLLLTTCRHLLSICLVIEHILHIKSAVCICRGFEYMG